jgi:two-component system cell cycle sensor histidine kinase/response regulator CckA
VLVAENGEAALEILEREGKVDLMISDVVMPTMDGPTTVRAARKLHADLPILFISGYAEEQLRKSIDIPKRPRFSPSLSRFSSLPRRCAM